MILIRLSLSSSRAAEHIGQQLVASMICQSHVLRLVQCQMNPSQVFLECASPCFLWTTSSYDQTYL